MYQDMSRSKYHASTFLMASSENMFPVFGSTQGQKFIIPRLFSRHKQCELLTAYANDNSFPKFRILALVFWGSTRFWWCLLSEQQYIVVAGDRVIFRPPHCWKMATKGALVVVGVEVFMKLLTGGVYLLCIAEACSWQNFVHGNGVQLNSAYVNNAYCTHKFVHRLRADVH